MLPNSPHYTKKGHEDVAREVDGLLPIRNLPGLNSKLTRWDGFQGTIQEISEQCLKEIRQAIDEPRGGDWVDLGRHHGVDREYHVGRTNANKGNRFFRFRSTIQASPQLIIAALMEPTVFGRVDALVRHARPLLDFPDGRHRIAYVVAEAGPRPFFSDRDDCALSAYFPPHLVKGGKGEWYHVSCTLPDHFPSVSSAIRNHTQFWGYKLEPFHEARTGAIHTRVTLISQTDIFGWLPKSLVNQFIPSVLSDYIRHLEEHVVEMEKRGAPARMLTEAYRLHAHPNIV